MHIIETYALSCGVKIDEPYVFEHYATIPAEKFISFNKSVYPFYREIIELIQPVLDKHGIKIVQLRANPQNVDADLAVPNNLSFGQWAYIIKHSLLHFGEDDFLFDLAGHYDIPRVIMFSNTYPNTTKPYWGSQDKERILFTTGKLKKPSLSADPNHNFVRDIKPEQIALNIMELLGIPWKPTFETLYAGARYSPYHNILELVPVNGGIDVQGPAASLAVRMDYGFDEQFLGNVISRHKTSIVTNKPIQMGLLHTFRANVMEVAYIVDNQNHDMNFIKELGKLNLPYGVLSYDINAELKEKFYEIGFVNQMKVPDLSQVPALKDGLKGLMYKSGKRVIDNKGEYKGYYDFKHNHPSKPNEWFACPENADKDFLKELDFFLIARPLS